MRWVPNDGTVKLKNNYFSFKHENTTIRISLPEDIKHKLEFLTLFYYVDTDADLRAKLAAG